MRRERGIVLYVAERQAGGVLAADADAGASALVLVDATDFDDAGGAAIVDDEPVSYLTVDDDAETISLAAPLAAAHAAGAAVLVQPAAVERIAHVRIDAAVDEGEEILARVPHALWDRIDTGARDPALAEWVCVVDDGRGWVVEDVLGREPAISGAYIQPGTVPPDATTDGQPPAASPTPTVRGGVGYLALSWPAIANHDPVTYEVHVATASGFSPSPSTLHSEVQGTLAFVRALPDGTALAYGAPYYVRLVARDADGSAPAGAEASGELVQATSSDIAVGSIAADQILAGAVTAEKLASVLAISSLFRAGAEDGQRVEMDANGIRLVAADSTVLVNLPSQAGVNPFFRATIEALGLDVTGDATLRGAANKLAAAANLDVQAGVADPTTAPTLTAEWDTVAITNLPANISQRIGLVYEPAGGSGGATKVFYLVNAVTDWSEIVELDASGLAGTGSYLRRSGTLGRTGLSAVAAVGTKLYHVARGETQADLNVLYLHRYGKASLAFETDDWASMLTGGTTPSYSYRMGLVRYAAASELWVLHAPNTTDFIIRKINDSTLAYKSQVTVAGGNLGATRTIIAAAIVGTYLYVQFAGATTVHAWDIANPAAPARAAAQDFPLPVAGHGIAHDGTRFWTARGAYSSPQASITKHSLLMPPAGEASMYARYSWYTTGSGAGESAASPEAAISWASLKRAKLRVGIPLFPSGVTFARYWLVPASASPALAAYERQIDSALIGGFSFDDYTIANAEQALAASTYAASTPGKIRSAAPTYANGAAEWRGDGLIKLALLVGDPSLAIGPDRGVVWFDNVRDKFRGYTNRGIRTIADSDDTPAGMIAAYGGASAPAGWLLCQGQQVSRTTYAALFAAIGTAYGAGDGSTTFNLPNLQGRFPLGKAASGTGSTLGATGGAIDHTHTNSATSSDSHSHSVNVASFNSGTGIYSSSLSSNVSTQSSSTSPPSHYHSINPPSTTSSSDSHSHTQSATGAANPPYQVVNYLIKT